MSRGRGPARTFLSSCRTCLLSSICLWLLLCSSSSSAAFGSTSSPRASLGRKGEKTEHFTHTQCSQMALDLESQPSLRGSEQHASLSLPLSRCSPRPGGPRRCRKEAGKSGTASPGENRVQASLSGAGSAAQGWLLLRHRAGGLSPFPGGGGQGAEAVWGQPLGGCGGSATKTAGFCLEPFQHWHRSHPNFWGSV